MSEEIVSGGQNRVFIRGGFVYRPSHPWSEGTRRLLDFCHAEGLEFVPEWHGRDKDGNEIFEYIEGEVGNYPLPKFLRNITAVVTAGRTLRRFHDATAKLIGDDTLRRQRLRAFFDAYGASREQMIAAVEILP
jgi:hypothetical protein